VNVDGSLNLLEIAVTQSRLQGREIKFIYPSSIAVYGLPDIATKQLAGKVKEDQWLTPRTMYGINKLYTEQLGRYYAKFLSPIGCRSRQKGKLIFVECVSPVLLAQ